MIGLASHDIIAAEVHDSEMLTTLLDPVEEAHWGVFMGMIPAVSRLQKCKVMEIKLPLCA